MSNELYGFHTVIQANTAPGGEIIYNSPAINFFHPMRSERNPTPFTKEDVERKIADVQHDTAASITLTQRSIERLTMKGTQLQNQIDALLLQTAPISAPTPFTEALPVCQGVYLFHLST